MYLLDNAAQENGTRYGTPVRHFFGVPFGHEEGAVTQFSPTRRTALRPKNLCLPDGGGTPTSGSGGGLRT